MFIINIHFLLKEICDKSNVRWVLVLLKCLRFSRELTTPWSLGTRKYENNKFDFQLDIIFISSLCLHIGILQHCTSLRYQVVPKFKTFIQLTSKNRNRYQ